MASVQPPRSRRLGVLAGGAAPSVRGGDLGRLSTLARGSTRCQIAQCGNAVTCPKTSLTNVGGTSMSVQEQEDAVRRWIAAWNAQDLDRAGQLLSPDFVRHDANLPEVVGPAAQRDFLRGVFSAFPDIHVQVQQLITQGDTIAARLVIQGTHRAEFLGVPSTGRRITMESVDIFRLQDEKIAEQWVLMNALGLMQQLGAIPSVT